MRQKDRQERRQQRFEAQRVGRTPAAILLDIDVMMHQLGESNSPPDRIFVALQHRYPVICAGNCEMSAKVSPCRVSASSTASEVHTMESIFLSGGRVVQPATKYAMTAAFLSFVHASNCAASSV